MVLTARRVRRQLSLASRMGPVVAILVTLGACGAVAVPNFMRFGCRAQHAEAKASLKELLRAQEAYLDEFDHYAHDPTIAGRFLWAPSSTRPRYRHGVAVGSDASVPHFQAWAFAVEGSAQGDLWTIDPRNELNHVIDGCAR